MLFSKIILTLNSFTWKILLLPALDLRWTSLQDLSWIKKIVFLLWLIFILLNFYLSLLIGLHVFIHVMLNIFTFYYWINFLLFLYDFFLHWTNFFLFLNGFFLYWLILCFFFHLFLLFWCNFLSFLANSQESKVFIEYLHLFWPLRILLDLRFFFHTWGVEFIRINLLNFLLVREFWVSTVLKIAHLRWY